MRHCHTQRTFLMIILNIFSLAPFVHAENWEKIAEISVLSVQQSDDAYKKELEKTDCFTVPGGALGSELFVDKAGDIHVNLYPSGVSGGNTLRVFRSGVWQFENTFGGERQKEYSDFFNRYSSIHFDLTGKVTEPEFAGLFFKNVSAKLDYAKVILFLDHIFEKEYRKEVEAEPKALNYKYWFYGSKHWGMLTKDDKLKCIRVWIKKISNKIATGHDIEWTKIGNTYYGLVLIDNDGVKSPFLYHDDGPYELANAIESIEGNPEIFARLNFGKESVVLIHPYLCRFVYAGDSYDYIYFFSHKNRLIMTVGDFLICLDLDGRLIKKEKLPIGDQHVAPRAFYFDDQYLYILCGYKKGIMAIQRRKLDTLLR